MVSVTTYGLIFGGLVDIQSPVFKLWNRTTGMDTKERNVGMTYDKEEVWKLKKKPASTL